MVTPTTVRDGAAGLEVLVVAHDAVIVAVRHVLAGLGSPAPDAAPVANASIPRWDGDGARLLLDEYGATGHLGDLAPS
ncbi:hypothetical protein ACFY2W_36975 [Streptomyces sp. NPDC001262]|uniref:hypothetical protein n=1 Tax=Streptomyces sp. NPDC001262 TaxID=3364552 RepID=UPI0036BE8784